MKTILNPITYIINKRYVTAKEQYHNFWLEKTTTKNSDICCLSEKWPKIDMNNLVHINFKIRKFMDRLNQSNRDVMDHVRDLVHCMRLCQGDNL